VIFLVIFARDQRHRVTADNAAARITRICKGRGDRSTLGSCRGEQELVSKGCVRREIEMTEAKAVSNDFQFGCDSEDGVVTGYSG
jgi:hypothetical protein